MNKEYVVINDKFGLGKKPIKGKDYVETDNTFTIFNVPILAEMVQSYDDGNALKDANEIKRVQVENVPLTIVDESPSHPYTHLSEMNTVEKTNFVVGFMSEPGKPKADASPKKRYADFILYKTPKTKSIIDTYLKGEYIDTSIGFRFEKDERNGTLDGVSYDYVQRNIVLDHNAILIDQEGNIGLGRMPAPIGGIGADSRGKEKMAEDKEMQKQIDALTKEKEDLKAELDQVKAEQDAAQKKTTDELQKTVDNLKVDLAKNEEELKNTKDELQKYKDEEQKEIDAKREELKKEWPKVAEVLDKAENDFIIAKHEELQEAKKKQSDSKKLGTDLMGPSDSQRANAKSEADRIKNRYKKKEKSE